MKWTTDLRVQEARILKLAKGLQAQEVRTSHPKTNHQKHQEKQLGKLIWLGRIQYAAGAEEQSLQQTSNMNPNDSLKSFLYSENSFLTPWSWSPWGVGILNLIHFINLCVIKTTQMA